MTSGQPDYTRQVAVTVIDTPDTINVTTLPGSQPVNVQFPATQDVNLKSQTANVAVDVKSMPASSTVAVASMPTSSGVQIKGQDAALTTTPSLPYISGRSAVFEDTSFVQGDTGVIHDVHTALGRNAHDGYLICDGPGNLTFQYSDDGTNWSGSHTIFPNQPLRLNGLDINKIKLTWITDSAYRIGVV